MHHTLLHAFKLVVVFLVNVLIIVEAVLNFGSSSFWGVGQKKIWLETNMGQHGDESDMRPRTKLSCNYFKTFPNYSLTPLLLHRTATLFIVQN